MIKRAITDIFHPIFPSYRTVARDEAIRDRTLADDKASAAVHGPAGVLNNETV